MDSTTNPNHLEIECEHIPLAISSRAAKINNYQLNANNGQLSYISSEPDDI